MKTRILSALVGIVLLIAALFCPFTIVLAVLLAAIAALAVWELLHTTGRVQDSMLLFSSMVFAAAQVLLLYGWQWEQTVSNVTTASFSFITNLRLPLLVLLLYGVCLVLAMLRRHETIDAAMLGYAAFVTVYATAGFASLAALRVMPHGVFLFLTVLIISWMSDTGAYFVGVFFGRHKMTPVISPKKSWEGFFGGWVVSVLSAMLAGLIYQRAFGGPALWPVLGVLAFVAAPLSVCGDLFASVIKRQSGVKDYGHIMPGHGGVMDRFDSVVFIAPILYVLFSLVL